MDEIKKLLPEIYKDIAKPTTEKVGVALSHVIGIIVTPIGLGAKILEKNLEKYVKKLENEDVVNPVPPELGVPIIEKLKYTRPEELANLYTELLTQASTSKGLESAHPAYIDIIASLSVDEARILEYLSKQQQDNIPFLELRYSMDNGTSYKIITKYFTDIPEKIELIYSNNMQMYLNNLNRLGLIEPAASGYIHNPDTYTPLLENKLVKSTESELQAESKVLGQEIKFIPEKSYFTITKFGRSFFATCIHSKSGH